MSWLSKYLATSSTRTYRKQKIKKKKAWYYWRANINGLILAHGHGTCLVVTCKKKKQRWMCCISVSSPAWSGGEDRCRNKQEPFCLIWEDIIRPDKPALWGGWERREAQPCNIVVVPRSWTAQRSKCKQPCSPGTHAGTQAEALTVHAHTSIM